MIFELKFSNSQLKVLFISNSTFNCHNVVCKFFGIKPFLNIFASAEGVPKKKR